MRSLTVSVVVILLLAIYCHEEVSGKVYFNIIPLLRKEYGGFLTSKYYLRSVRYKGVNVLFLGSKVEKLTAVDLWPWMRRYRYCC